MAAVVVLRMYWCRYDCNHTLEGAVAALARYVETKLNDYPQTVEHDGRLSLAKEMVPRTPCPPKEVLDALWSRTKECELMPGKSFSTLAAEGAITIDIYGLD